jgi:hypothetical protein
LLPLTSTGIDLNLGREEGGKALNRSKALAEIVNPSVA